MSKKIVSFYKFKKLNNIDNLRNIIFRFMKKNSVKEVWLNIIYQEKEILGSVSTKK